jgi:hypothetical protein
MQSNAASKTRKNVTPEYEDEEKKEATQGHLPPKSSVEKESDKDSEDEHSEDDHAYEGTKKLIDFDAKLKAQKEES